jgi:hypothetical protein
MAILTDEIKEFIVKGLACFDTPSYVAEAVRVNFGIEISRQQVHEYDPACSRPPAQRWRELHAVTREMFLRDTAEIGLSHKTVRLRMLDRLAHRCERNSVALALACLERAAKECGGMYEKRSGAMPQPSAPKLTPAEPQTPQPQTPQPQTSAPEILQLPVSQPAPTPMSPALELTADQYIEYLASRRADRGRTALPVPSQPQSQPQNHPVTGNSRISTVPPAS